MVSANETVERAIEDAAETDVSSLVDERIAKALGLKPSELDDLPAEPGVMSTPSVLSAVRVTVYAHC
jgi:hypothetical protein